MKHNGPRASSHQVLPFPGRFPTQFLFHLRTPLLQAVYLRQIYFSGVQAVFLALAAGATMAWMFFNLLHQRFHNDADFTLHMLATVGLQELAPLLVSLLLVARSVSAVVTELAGMKVSGEISMLKRHGVNPTEYLLAPRLAGFLLAAAMLFIYFSVAALVAGCILTAPFNPWIQLYRLAETQEWGPISQGLVRSVTFAGVVAMIACLFGLHGPALSSAVPRTAGRAVILSLLFVFVFDGLASYLDI